MLPPINGVNIVYLWFRYDPYSENTYGPISQQIFLDTTTPTVTITSPAGLPLAGSVQQTGNEQQMLSTSAQYITYSVSSFAGDPIQEVQLYACSYTAGCPSQALATITTPAAPYAVPVDIPAGTTYISATATNSAGTPGYSTNDTEAFSIFGNPIVGSPYGVTCGPSVQSPVEYCPTEAPTGTSPNCTPECGSQSQDSATLTFSGFADPSIRRDPSTSSTSPSNPNGTNLWMLYSYPTLQPDRKSTTGYDQVLEIHVAYSTNGADNWAAGQPDCNGCTLNNSPSTTAAIWPSVQFGTVGSPTVSSSHEVSNFWPYTNSAGTVTWLAVHLMYFVSSTYPIAQAIPITGCLVTTTASTPQGLGANWWLTDSVPDSCYLPGTFEPNTMPNGSQATTFDSLSLAAGLQAAGTCPAITEHGQTETCYWGEPAVMVQEVGGVPTAYLAVACFSGNSFTSLGYYIFTSPLSSTTGLPTGWTLYSGPFTYSNLLSATGMPQPSPTGYPGAYTGSGFPEICETCAYGFLTEFDWAARSDSSLVAVVAISAILYFPGTDPYYAAQQYGCVAVNFSLAQSPPPPAGPFAGGIVATFTDSDQPNSGPTENLGPAGCTYEPTSNTGAVIVRKLVNGSSDEVYSLIGTGLMP
jgi:hypothetical protein